MSSNSDSNGNNNIICSLLYRVLYGIPMSNDMSRECDSCQQQVIHKNKSKQNSLLFKSFATNTNSCSNTCNTSEASSQVSRSTQTSKIGYFGLLPNEVVVHIFQLLSFKDLSVISITNKVFRDFVIDYFIKSKTGFEALLSKYCFASNSKTVEEQEKRVETFNFLGLLLKRSTCLYPTTDRILLLIQTFGKMDGIPSPTIMANDNIEMRFIFQCYGKLIHRLIAGWDDCEVKYVFSVLQSVTHMEQHINTLLNSALGARQSLEYYVRSFYRMVCIDPISRSERFKDRVFWLNQILKPHSLTNRAKLLVIIFGPLISIAPTPGSIPYIGWWDMTDTFFIQNGLEELGFAIHLLYRHQIKDSIWNQQNVISLFETIISLPEHWLQENIATLLFFAGDDITYQYLNVKLTAENYNEVAQCIVYLTLVTYKLTHETSSVLELIEKLVAHDHRANLINELPIAFSEAIADIDNLIELEEERDVTELHEIISAQSDLMKQLMLKTFSSKSENNSDKQIESSLEFKSSHEE